MSLSLSERIARKEQQNPGRRNLYEPAFLALKTDIHQALQDGWSMRQIWSTLKEEKKVGCSYLWFRNLVKRHIVDQPAGLPVKRPSKPAKTGIESESDKHGFNYQASFNKEELI